VFNQIGLYRLGLKNRPAPSPTPRGLSASEWNTIWGLIESSKARSALLQDIASWQKTITQARAAGSLGDRPLIVVRCEDTVVAPEHLGIWMELQTDLARLSSRGKVMAVGKGIGDPLYQAPGAIVDATREVLGDIQATKDRDAGGLFR
jgi:hypothetical protein